MAVFFLFIGLFVIAVLLFLFVIGLLSPFIIWSAWKKYREQQNAQKS